MGFWQLGFGLVFILTLGLSDAQWRARAAHSRSPSEFRPKALAQASQQADSRMSVVPSKPVFAPQTFPAPVRTDFGKPSQDLMGVQSKEMLQGPVAKLTWSFPSLPEEPQQPDVPFELPHPIPASSVAAQCGENSVHVEVKKDFFGTGIPLLSSAFTLGGCTASGEDPSAQVLIFESELHGCSSTSTVTVDELVYTFNIIYTPQAVSYSVPIVRSSSAVVGIECHYPRTHNVSSHALMPTWIPHASTKIAEEAFVFSLKLMTDDWLFERPSNQYFLGDVINLEASVRLYRHVPVRVFVDSCMATAVPDVASVPRYSFIENNGCLVDAKLTSSTSHFMPRTQGDKLRFQLEAFRFQQADSGLVYITCILKAAAAAPSSEQKACSFSANGWVSADDSDQVCGCCDTTCSIRSGSDRLLTDLRWEKASVGPINVKDHGQNELKAQNMDGERERLNQRIAVLTDQLSAAKTTIQSLETINVTSMLQDALVKHLKSDDPITPLPVAPPPAQFMDSDRYEKVSMHADDQSLGTLPEEEESDWSEMGEEAQNCVLRGSQGNHGNASYYQWQQRHGCWEGVNHYSKGIVDTESESGGEESKCHHPPHGLQIPHLKFTVHPETLPIPIEDVSLARFKQSPDGPDCDGYHITEVRNLGSPIRVLSASLEEIHSIGLLKQQEQQQEHHGHLRSNKSMMDLHQTQIGTRQVSYEDEIECNWREANSHGVGEDINGMVGLESAQKMLNHFIHDGESTHL